MRDDGLTERYEALLERVTVLEVALERIATVATEALIGTGYRDLHHHDRAQDEKAEGLTNERRSDD